MGSTFRTDARAAIKTVLDAFQAANPERVKVVYRARPGAFPATPCIYIGGSDEAITYTAQTRNRQMTDFSFVLVDNLIDASTSEDRMDATVDLLVDACWNAFNSMPGGRGLLQLTSVRDVDIVLEGPNGNTVYRGARFGFDDPRNPTFVLEGGP